MCDDDILLLTDDDGNDISFQIIDTVDVDNETYAILTPLDDEDDDDTILIFRIIEDEEGQQYDQVEDEPIIQRVFDIFRSSDEDYDFCDAE